ncbi:hypothetical protein CEF21_21075 [Bacillus sp. FJAT-42376]|uniref:hypothetical protein n=1 Tax=Bacillus sp. FJAT-42376 TaxID=2014076 RepID=UPI000F4E3168|nr:hypothetical protein [Bacillus sp. FJAT-42376]AZB44576.1 hypothetical protein CEF21_21075 [Bacillus sp. FJAT-42376]
MGKKKRFGKSSAFVMSSAFVASAAVVSPAPASASSVTVNELVKNAQLTVSQLKPFYGSGNTQLVLSVEVSKLYSKASSQIDLAKKALYGYKGKDKSRLQQQLENAVNEHVKAARLIDAINAGVKLEKQTNALMQYINADEMNMEMVKVYDQLSEQMKKTEKASSKIYGENKRLLAEKKYVLPAKIAKESVKYEVSKFNLLEKAKLWISKGKVKEAEELTQMLSRLEERAVEIKQTGNKIHPGKYPALTGMNTALKNTKDTVLSQFVLKISAASKDPLKPTVYGNEIKKVINRNVILIAGESSFIKLKNLEINGDLIIQGANDIGGNVELSNIKVNGTIKIHDAEKAALNKVDAAQLTVLDQRIMKRAMLQTLQSVSAIKDEGPQLSIDSESSLTNVEIAKKAELFAAPGAHVDSVLVKPAKEGERISFKGDFSNSKVTLEGENPEVSLSSSAKIREFQVKTQATITAETGAVLEKVEVNSTKAGDVLTLAGDLSKSKITVSGSGNGLKIEENAKVREIEVKAEATVEAGKGSEVAAVSVASQSKDSKITLKGDFSKTSVDIQNSNAKLVIPENTVVKEVKKDPSVTGTVQIENKGNVETATGIVIPGTPSGSAAPAGGGVSPGPVAIDFSVTDVTVSDSTAVTFVSSKVPASVEWNGMKVAAASVEGERNKYSIQVPAIKNIENILVVKDDKDTSKTINYKIQTGSYGNLKVLNEHSNVVKTVSEAADHDTFLMESGTYELSKQLLVSKAIAIIGNGDVVISPKDDFAFTESYEKNLVSINNVAGEMNLENVTILNSIGSGINVFESQNVKLKDVRSIGNASAGLIINSSRVEAEKLKTDGNKWYGVNVDKGSNPSSPELAASFKLVNGTLLEPTQIFSNKGEVTAPGYKKYKVADTSAALWTNREQVLTKGAVIEGGETFYPTVEAAVKAADAGAVIHVSGGTYELSKQLLIMKPITIKGEGNVAISPKSDFTATESYENNLISINGVAGQVKLENLTIRNAKASGINVFESQNVKLKNVHSSHNGAAGLIVNSSIVEADEFYTIDNKWYGVNVDKGSNPSSSTLVTSFKFLKGSISEETQIISDKGNVSVTAEGFEEYKIGGTSKVFWTSYGQPRTKGAIINNTVYPTLETAVQAADEDAVIHVNEGTYELPKQLLISKPVTIIGNGEVVLKPKADYKASAGYENNLVSINGVAGAVKLENLTIQDALGSGINVYESNNVKLKNVRSLNNNEAGMIVNSSVVEAEDLRTNGNKWYGVNVDKGSNPSNPNLVTSFTLTSGALLEPTKIFSDNGDVTVSAEGFEKYSVAGTSKLFWTNQGQPLAKGAVIKGEKTLYPTLEAAVQAAKEGATIWVNEGEYELSKQLVITKPVTIIGNGQVVLKPKGNYTPSAPYEKNLVSVTGVAGKVELQNLTIKNAQGSGLNIFESQDVTLKKVNSIGNTAAGLIVNSSVVEASDFTTSGNGWYGVNVDKGSNPSSSAPAAKFTLHSGSLSEPAQIVSDKGGVEVIADLELYRVAGSSKLIWTNQGQPLAKGAVIQGERTLYPTLEEAVQASKEGAIIYVNEGEYELSKQLAITKPVTIIGKGRVVFKPKAGYTYSAGYEKNLLSINGVAGAVKLENLIIQNAPGSGLNVYESQNVSLVEVQANDNAAAGLIINSSVVEADGFYTKGNSWYGVNIDKGSNPSNASLTPSFNFKRGTLSEDIQIFSDYGDVSVGAPGYKKINLEGSSKVVWSNKQQPLENGNASSPSQPADNTKAPSAELASNRLVTASLDMDKDFKLEDGVVKFN